MLFSSLRVLVGLVVASGFVMAVAVSAQGPPVDASASFVDASCGFPVQVEITGKSGFIALPRDRAMVTFPANWVTLTNLADPERTFRTSISGSFHLTFLEDGVILLNATGRNLHIGFGPGMLLSIGSFSQALDPLGNEVEPLGGNGQLIDVCSLIN